MPQILPARSIDRSGYLADARCRWAHNRAEIQRRLRCWARQNWTCASMS